MAWKAAQRARAWEHIRELAAEHKITVHRCARMDASAHETANYGRVVRIPRSMRAPIDYLVALHEMGHLRQASALAVARSRFAGTSPGTQIAGTMKCEAAAWGWAADNADPALLRHITDADWDIVGGQMMGSFLKHHARVRRARRG